MRHTLATRSNRGRPSPQGLGARIAAWLCLLIVAVASTAQAVHVHGGGFPSRNASIRHVDARARRGAESKSPLCVAMHSAMPAAVGHAVVPIALEITETTPGQLPFVPELQHFAGFSRPPPAASIR
jgi:hypothetical protein